MHHNHCAHPGATTNAWWTVNFGERYSIGRVVIYNRGDCCEYSSDTVLSRHFLKYPNTSVYVISLLNIEIPTLIYTSESQKYHKQTKLSLKERLAVMLFSNIFSH